MIIDINQEPSLSKIEVLTINKELLLSWETRNLTHPLQDYQL